MSSILPKALTDFPSAVSDIARNGWNDNNREKVVKAVSLTAAATAVGVGIYFTGGTILKAAAVAALVLANLEAVLLVAGGFLCNYGIPTAIAGWNAGLLGPTIIGTACTSLGIKVVAHSVAKFGRSILSTFRPTPARA